jgi:solute carrier family 13 (sodium-dependent dicarboxylate transporter), member 2/3/5
MLENYRGVMSVKTIGFALGVVAFASVLVAPPFETFQIAASNIIKSQNVLLAPQELARSMQVVAALLVLMVVWWLSEAIPLSWTACLPLIILPIASAVGFNKNAVHELTIVNVAKNYVSPIVLLFFGGFLIAAAMQKWKLDRRFTLWILTRGTLAEDTRKTLFGMMGVTAFISMWISNTASTAMMLPLGLGILSLAGVERGNSRFGTALMLGIAWSSSIGGVGTLLGTPPNGIAVGILNATLAQDPTFQRITFLDWMKFGIPYVILVLPIAWLLIIKAFPPELKSFQGGKARLVADLHSLGVFAIGEKVTVFMFLLAVTLWLAMPFSDHFLPASWARQLQWLDEYMIGFVIGTSLFFIPISIKRRTVLLSWRDTKFIEWSALLITGGGIALSDAMFRTGFASWIAVTFVGMFGSPSTLTMMIIITLFVILLTEVASNSAVTSMMVPVVISIASTTGGHPVALALATTFAASMGFMMPVGTPPNAMVYGTGFVRMRDMVRVGFVLDLMSWVFTVTILVVFGWLIFGLFSL